jgi:hypothetical protein
VKNDFNLAVGIAEIFKNGTPDEKEDALLETGSNLTLKAKTLTIYEKKEISIIINGLLVAKAINKNFEPKESLTNNDKTEVFSSVCPSLLR